MVTTWVTAVVALLIAGGGTPVAMLGLRRMNCFDLPNGRSSHDHPILRGGGVAPALAVLVAVGLSHDLVGRPRLGVLAATAGFGAIGLIEDVRGMRLSARFGCQVLAAALAVAGLLGGLAGPPLWRVALAVGALLWTVSYVNAFNFMDGIDGISAAQAVVAGTGWCLIGLSQDVAPLAAAGVIVATAAGGFVPFNFPRSRVFLGDVGSYALGAALATLLIVGLRAGITPEAMGAPLALYLADTGVTLVRRVLRGEAWHLAHCDHAYQRLVRHGWSHVRTTAVACVWMVACAAAGALTLVETVALRVIVDALLVGLLVAWLALPVLVARRQRRQTGAGRTPLSSPTSSSARSWP